MASPGRPRRVLIVVENLPVPFDRRVWQEATTLQRAGYEVSVICPTGKGADRRHEVLDGVHIHRHPLPFEADSALGYAVEYACALVWEGWLTLRVALTRGFDVLHACNPPDDIFLLGALGKLFGKRFVFDHHDANPELYLAKFGRQDLYYRILRTLEFMSFRTANAVITTNDSYRRIALTRGRVAPQRVHVVRSGPSLERLRSGPAVERWRNGRHYVVAYVGVMGRQEGIPYLLDAARHVVIERGRRDTQFCLVGGGTELEALRARSGELGLGDYVTFTGRVPDEVLLEVLNTADVCVNPDPQDPMNDISTMNKIMEYMALGKPIVQFDLTEGRVSAQEASLYARPNDALDMGEKILALLDDPAARARMGALGRTRIETQLEWRYEAPKLLAAYETLFAAPAS